MMKNTDAPHNPPSGNVAFWYDPRKRSILYQLGVLAMVGLLGYYLVSNTLANLERPQDLGFLRRKPLLKSVNPLFLTRLRTITHALCWSAF
jgi:ABC-type amino acid transport system permease subunit